MDRAHGPKVAVSHVLQKLNEQTHEGGRSDVLGASRGPACSELPAALLARHGRTTVGPYLRAGLRLDANHQQSLLTERIQMPRLTSL